MRHSVRILVIGLLLALALASCRPPYPTVTPTPTPAPPILSPRYQADSYKELIERNWVAFADQPPTMTFDEFVRTVKANRLPSEDLQDVYATLFAIASQHAFAQGTPLDGDYFLVAARLASWWHPPSSPPASAKWISRRPYVISTAFESELARLNLADRVDTSIYAMNPDDVLELLRTTEAELFFQTAP